LHLTNSKSHGHSAAQRSSRLYRRFRHRLHQMADAAAVDTAPAAEAPAAEPAAAPAPAAPASEPDAATPEGDGADGGAGDAAPGADTTDPKFTMSVRKSEGDGDGAADEASSDAQATIGA
jgi:hypothetical protein